MATRRSGERWLHAGACAVVLLAGVAPAAASSGGVRVTGPFWSEVGSPGHRRVGQLLAQARRHLAQAERLLPGNWEETCDRTHALRLPVDGERVRRGRQRALMRFARLALRRRAAHESALARLERAAELAPEDPEVLYLMGRTLMAWEQPGALSSCVTLRREPEAIEVLTRLARVAPGFRAQEVAFELAVLHTRAHAFEAAAREYERAIALSLDPRDTSTARSNLAEMTMLSGRVERALAQYRRAIELSRDARDFQLATWGLAVALDRLGEHAAALQEAGRAVAGAGGTLAALRQDGVFYEPDHEVHYYEALGHEAIAARDDADRTRALKLAAESWRAYLAAEPEHSSFARTAAANLARVEAELEPPRTTRPSRQRPTRTADTLP